MAKKFAPSTRSHARPKAGTITAGAADGPQYNELLSDLSAPLARSRAAAARVVNGVITATYY